MESTSLQVEFQDKFSTGDTQEALKELDRRLAAGRLHTDLETMRSVLNDVKEKTDSAFAAFQAEFERMKAAGINTDEASRLAQFSVAGSETGITDREGRKIYRTQMVNHIEKFLSEQVAENTITAEQASDILLRGMEALKYRNGTIEKSLWDAMRMVYDPNLLATPSSRASIADEMGSGESSISLGEHITLGGRTFTVNKAEVLTGAAMTEISPGLTVAFVLQNVVLRNDGKIWARMQNGCEGNLVILDVSEEPPLTAFAPIEEERRRASMLRNDPRYSMLSALPEDSRLTYSAIREDEGRLLRWATLQRDGEEPVYYMLVAPDREHSTTMQLVEVTTAEGIDPVVGTTPQTIERPEGLRLAWRLDGIPPATKDKPPSSEDEDNHPPQAEYNEEQKQVAYQLLKSFAAELQNPNLHYGRITEADNNAEQLLTWESPSGRFYYLLSVPFADPSQAQITQIKGPDDKTAVEGTTPLKITTPLQLRTFLQIPANTSDTPPVGRVGTREALEQDAAYTFLKNIPKQLPTVFYTNTNVQEEAGKLFIVVGVNLGQKREPTYFKLSKTKGESGTQFEVVRVKDQNGTPLGDSAARGERMNNPQMFVNLLKQTDFVQKVVSSLPQGSQPNIQYGEQYLNIVFQYGDFYFKILKPMAEESTTVSVLQIVGMDNLQMIQNGQILTYPTPKELKKYFPKPMPEAPANDEERREETGTSTEQPRVTTAPRIDREQRERSERPASTWENTTPVLHQLAQELRIPDIILWKNANRYNYKTIQDNISKFRQAWQLTSLAAKMGLQKNAIPLILGNPGRLWGSDEGVVQYPAGSGKYAIEFNYNRSAEEIAASIDRYWLKVAEILKQSSITPEIVNQELANLSADLRCPKIIVMGRNYSQKELWDIHEAIPTLRLALSRIDPQFRNAMLAQNYGIKEFIISGDPYRAYDSSGLVKQFIHPHSYSININIWQLPTATLLKRAIETLWIKHRFVNGFDPVTPNPSPPATEEAKKPVLSDTFKTAFQTEWTALKKSEPDLASAKSIDTVQVTHSASGDTNVQITYTNKDNQQKQTSLVIVGEFNVTNEALLSWIKSLQ